MSDGEIEQLGVEGENELEYNVWQCLAHDITGHQNVILHRSALNINLSDRYLGGEVGLGPGHNVHVSFLLDFVVALRYKTLGQIDGSSPSQVQVRVQPGRGDDVEGGGAPATVRTFRQKHFIRGKFMFKTHILHQKFPSRQKGSN